jgi:hypothetical protein
MALIGLYVLSTGLEGWYRGRLSQPLRFISVIAAAMMLMPPTESIAGLPGYLYWVAGSVIAAGVLGPRFMQARREAAEAANGSSANLTGGEA